MFEFKLRLPIFLILLLIPTIPSVPVDSKDCETSHTCSPNLKSSSDVVANKTLTQSSSISSQRKETNFVSVGNDNLLHNKSVEVNKILQDFWAKLPKNGTVNVKLTSDLYSQLVQSVQQLSAHESSGNASYESTTVGHKIKFSAEQINQLLLQLQAKTPKHEKAINGSEPHRNSTDTNYELIKIKNKSHDAKRQLSQVLQKVFALRPNPKNHTLADRGNSSDVNNQLNNQPPSLDSNRQIKRLMLQSQAKSLKHEKAINGSQHEHVEPHEASSDTKVDHKRYDAKRQLEQVVQLVMTHRSKPETVNVAPHRNSSDANNQLKRQHRSHDANE